MQTDVRRHHVRTHTLVLVGRPVCIEAPRPPTRPPHRHLSHLGRGHWKSKSGQRWAELVGLAGLVAATAAAICVAHRRQLPSRVVQYSTVPLR